MSYTINKSDGTAVTVADNTIDQAYYNPNANGAGKGVGTQLVGNNFAGFYQPMAQNFLQLTENFAGPNMPSDTTALQGQLWFKKNSPSDGELFLRTNSLTAGGMNNWTSVVLNKPGAINGLLPPQSGQAGTVLSTNGTNPVWVPMGGYTLPIATASTLGGVKVGSGLSISATGELANTYTYILPKADYDTLGGVRVGNGLQVDGNGTISVIGGGGGSYTLPPATALTLGGIKVGSGLSVTPDGTLSATGGGGGGVTYTLANSIVGSNAALALTGSDSSVSKVQLLSNTLAITQGSDANGPFARFEYTGGGGSGVTQIVAGANVSISPTSGTGVVTINAIAGGGGVSSVGITSSDMTVSNSPITSSGNINLSLNTVPVVKGGTGITSFAQGEILFGNSGGTLSKLSPGTAGQVLTTNGPGSNPTWTTAGGSYTLPPATASVLGGIKVGSGLTITGDGTLSATGGGSGTVTSVAISSSDLSVSGSPITTSGTITVNLNTVSATKGGTGQTSYTRGDIIYSGATNSLTKLPIGSNGQVLTVGSTGIPEWTTAGGGGYVLPTASATTLGGIKVGSNLNIDANGVLSVAGVGTVTSVGITSSDLTVSNSPVTSSGNITVNLNTVAPTKGGTGLTSYAKGDIIYSSAANSLAKLSIGSTGQVLTVDATGVPVWASGGGGGGYVLPPATTSVLGGIKVGSGLAITSDGTLSATGGGSVPGTNQQLIFNNSGALAGTSKIAYNDAQNLLTVGTSTSNFRIQGATANSSSSNNILTISGPDQDNISGPGGNIVVTGGFAGDNGTGGNITIKSGMSFAGTNPGTIFLNTGTSPRLRIDGNGAWGLNGTSYGTAGQVLTSNGSSSPPTWTTVGGGGGSGTVTSVGLTMPSGFTVGSSPVTSSGTIAVSTSLNGILAGNGSGFTTITVGSGLTYTGGTLSASGSSYILPPATASVLGGIKVGSGLAVTADGTLSVTGGGGGSGTVTSVGITSSDLSVSNSPITSSGNITLNLNTVSPTKGGTGQSAYTKGDLLYSAASNSLSRLPIGTTGQVLTVDATGVPVWAASGGGGGGVTQIIAGTGVTISPTGGTGAVTINATGSGGGSEPAIVAFKYTAGGSGTFNSAGGAADVIISQTGGVTAALTDPSNCIVTFTFTGRTTPPKSIMIYGQNYSANTFSTISVGLGANNVINGGGTAASPALITGFTSANTVKLQLTMSATGASAGVGQRAHCMVVFGF